MHYLVKKFGTGLAAPSIGFGPRGAVQPSVDVDSYLTSAGAFDADIVRAHRFTTEDRARVALKKYLGDDVGRYDVITSP